MKKELVSMTQTFRFNNDADSWAHLDKHGFKQTRAGLIYHPDPAYRFRPGDSEALDELCNEWDYGWAGVNRPGVHTPYLERP